MTEPTAALTRAGTPPPNRPDQRGGVALGASGALSSKHQELMSESKQLSFQVGAPAKEVSDCGK